MKNTFEISQFNPCLDGLTYRQTMPDFKTAWEQCPRGDWMLWIAKKLDVDLLKLTTAKALCANTVRHLMKDARSTKAIDVALLFGIGQASKDQLNAAAYDAYAADVAYADYAADVAYAAAAVDAAVMDTAAVYAADAADTKKQNQLQTANICRDVLTEVVFEKLGIL